MSSGGDRVRCTLRIEERWCEAYTVVGLGASQKQTTNTSWRNQCEISRYADTQQDKARIPLRIHPGAAFRSSGQGAASADGSFRLAGTPQAKRSPQPAPCAGRRRRHGKGGGEGEPASNRAGGQGRAKRGAAPRPLELSARRRNSHSGGCTMLQVDCFVMDAHGPASTEATEELGGNKLHNGITSPHRGGEEAAVSGLPERRHISARSLRRPPPHARIGRAQGRHRATARGSPKRRAKAVACLHGS